MVHPGARVQEREAKRQRLKEEQVRARLHRVHGRSRPAVPASRAPQSHDLS
jgi:hypothetical protein